MKSVPKYFHKTFSNITKSNQTINCDGACAECMLCYTENNTSHIVEELKSKESKNTYRITWGGNDGKTLRKRKQICWSRNWWIRFVNWKQRIDWCCCKAKSINKNWKLLNKKDTKKSFTECIIKKIGGKEKIFIKKNKINSCVL